MTAPTAISLAGVTLRHGAQDVIRDLSGCFEPGSMTALVGVNGAGKTTLLRALAGLHPVAKGSIDRGGLAAADIALLPQGSMLDRSFPIACRDVVALGLAGRVGPFRGLERRDMRAADAALVAVGLRELGGKAIGALSAGQFQRVLFARLILQDAPVILLDEPFSAVDATTEADLLSLMHVWHGEGRTIIAVLHDQDLARDHFPQALRLAGEHTEWGATTTVLQRVKASRAAWLPNQAA